MHDLQLVGFTTDRRGLILRTRDGARAEASFVVPVTDELIELVTELAGARADERGDAEDLDERAAAADDDVVSEAPVERPRSSMSVRDIQARLRAGEPVDRIATEAGVDEDWIERFAPPIRAEQQRIVERALERHVERSRSAPSAVPLRRAVGMALADKGIAYTVAAYEAAWSARLLGHDRWAVEFTYRHRGRDRTASWTYDAAEDALTTSDRAAAQLGYVAPGAVSPDAGEPIDGVVGDPSAAAARSTTPVAEAEPPARSAPKKKAVAKKVGTKKKKESTAKKPASKKKVAASKASSKKKAAPKKAAAKKRAVAKKAPAKKRAVPKKAAAKRAAKRTGTSPKQAGPEQPPPEQASVEEPAAEKAVVVHTVVDPAAAPPPATRLPDEPRRPAARRPLDDSGRTPPAPSRPVAARPTEVQMADVPLAGEEQAPGANGRPAATERRGDGDPTSARRARAAQRNAPTVQFRSGSAAPARTASQDRRPGAGTTPPVDDTDRPRPGGGDVNGAARPTTRRRRQLRAR